MISTFVIPVTTSGSAGVATGSAQSDIIRGWLLDVHFDFNASAPNTTDTTLAYADGPQGTILTLSNTATDVLHMPLKQASDSAGAAITGVYGAWPVNGRLSVSVAGCDALTNAVVATLRFKDEL